MDDQESAGSAGWRKHYRKRLPEALLQLGRVGTAQQITELLAKQVGGVKLASVRQACEASSVNGIGGTNMHFVTKYDPEFHFLLKLAKGVYAFPDPRVIDMKAIFRRNKEQRLASWRKAGIDLTQASGRSPKRMRTEPVTVVDRGHKADSGH